MSRAPMRWLIALIAFIVAGASPTYAETVCLLVADAATGAVVHETGDCDTRVTPASTFKLALAVMGFDAGLLVDGDTPVLTHAPGEADWGGPAWTGTVSPAQWMDHSVVWYSQRLARALGADRLAGYGRDFGYGNGDFSGDPGFDNGLERSWIASSLLISPREQVSFLHRLVTAGLPVSHGAAGAALGLLTVHPSRDGWTIAGKTGGAYPRRADRSFDYARGWGWFVGFAYHENEAAYAFAQLDRDNARHAQSPGIRTRAALLENWPALAAQLPPAR